MSIRVHDLYYESSQITKNHTFVLMSDIHSDDKKLEQVYKIIDSEIQPEFITIPGDVIDSISDKRNEAIKQIFDYYGSKYPTFISLGNHDIADFPIINHRTMEIPTDTTDFFNNFGTKTIVFNNTNSGQKIDGSNIEIFGMELLTKWYQDHETKQEFEERLKSYTFDPNNFNILLFHSPNSFINNDGNLYELENSPTLILSGHNHGGMFPYQLHKIIPNNRGIIGPYNVILPKHAYGIYSDNNSSLIISDGITKFHYSYIGKYIAPIGNKIYIPDIYVIHVVPSKTLNQSGRRLALTKKETSIHR